MYGRVLEANGETDEPTVLLPRRDKLIFKFFHSADGLTLLDIQTSKHCTSFLLSYRPLARTRAQK